MSDDELMEELEYLESIGAPTVEEIARIYEIEQILSERCK